jgi:hypothetical protein
MTNKSNTCHKCETGNVVWFLDDVCVRKSNRKENKRIADSCLTMIKKEHLAIWEYLSLSVSVDLYKSAGDDGLSKFETFEVEILIMKTKTNVVFLKKHGFYYIPSRNVASIYW